MLTINEKLQSPEQLKRVEEWAVWTLRSTQTQLRRLRNAVSVNNVRAVEFVSEQQDEWCVFVNRFQNIFVKQESDPYFVAELLAFVERLTHFERERKN